MAAQNAFDFREIVARGWPVLSALGIMSVISMAVFLDRIIVFMKAKADPEAFVDEVLRKAASETPESVLEFCDKTPKPVAAVCGSVVRNAGSRENMEKAAHNATQGQLNRMETLLPVLATVASTAPFVGLLGTVVGVIRSFHDISVASGGGPEVVAAGISEALIATALGLFVAIPATMAYNFFVHRLQKMGREMDVAVFRLIEKLQ
jgi:biopolymer transport protein ExbB/TolQ